MCAVSRCTIPSSYRMALPSTVSREYGCSICFHGRSRSFTIQGAKKFPLAPLSRSAWYVRFRIVTSRKRCSCVPVVVAHRDFRGVWIACCPFTGDPRLLPLGGQGVAMFPVVG